MTAKIYVRKIERRTVFFEAVRSSSSSIHYVERDSTSLAKVRMSDELKPLEDFREATESEAALIASLREDE